MQIIHYSELHVVGGHGAGIMVIRGLLQIEVKEGALVCPETGRQFPITNGIPNMLSWGGSKRHIVMSWMNSRMAAGSVLPAIELLCVVVSMCMFANSLAIAPSCLKKSSKWCQMWNWGHGYNSITQHITIVGSYLLHMFFKTWIASIYTCSTIVQKNDDTYY